MKKRKGWLLLEALVSLSLLAVMAGAAFPAVTQIVKNLVFLEQRLYLQEDGLFAADYMTDKIRWTLERTEGTEQKTGTTYPIVAYNEDGDPADYFFMAEDKKWKLRLYTGIKQPLTGDNDKEPAYAVEEGERPYFTVEPGGLVRISYQMKAKSSKLMRGVDTAVLPLYDYFEVSGQ